MALVLSCQDDTFPNGDGSGGAGAAQPCSVLLLFGLLFCWSREGFDKGLLVPTAATRGGSVGAKGCCRV